MALEFIVSCIQVPDVSVEEIHVFLLSQVNNPRMLLEGKFI